MYSGLRGPENSRVAATQHTTAPELSLPALDLRLVARRAALPLALAAAAAAVLLLAGGPLGVFADALGRAISADPRWIAVAAVAELLSFGGYIALFWLVGRRASPRLDLRAGAEITLGGAAATRLIPTAGAGGAALTLWAINKTGMGAKRAGRVLLTFLSLLYGMFLLGITLSGAAIVLGVGGGGNTAVATVAAIGGGTAIVGALLLAARGDDAGAGAGRIARGAALLGGSVRDALGLLRRGDARLLGAPAWWAFDAAVLWATFHALGEPPALAVLAFAYFAGQVGNTIPLPGAVSGGMVGTLLAFGVAPDLALSSVLAYRAIAIWLPAPIGLAALGALRSRIARWSSEDAEAAELVEAIVTPARVPAAAAPRLHALPVPGLTAAPCPGSA
jgi:putative heme transporter